MAKAKILVVDDEAYTRVFLKKLLEGAGHEVVLAEDGEQAIKEAKRQIFDLIFIDIVMPGLDGLGTFREIRKTTSKDATVIIITGYTLEKETKEALELGAYTCLHKPFDPEETLKVVEEVLKKR